MCLKLYTFPKHERLKGKKNFSNLFKNGTRIKTKGITLIYLNNQLQHHRVGISIKGVKGACKRNLMKRKIRELYRLNKYELQNYCDLVFLPQKEFFDLPFAEQLKIIKELFNRANIQNAKNNS